MNIIDLQNKDDFLRTVQQLETKLLESKVDFDLIVAIPAGGREVVEKMPRLCENTPVCFMVKQRATTKYKNKFSLRSFLPYFPVFLNNILRIIESKVLELKFESNKKNNSGKPMEEVLPVDSDLKQKIKLSRSILVIDDAIDSGQTMASVISTIQSFNKNAKITTSAINSTFRYPLIKADYLIYEKALVRYPWANDVKKL